MTVLTATTQASTLAVRPSSLMAALDEAEAKRSAELIRFRTCCADPRASK
ncbi:MAG TPA: hypothetical protein VFQ44_13675 [Streptosporangiaceae bacterium]|nr:hypothetical protein [Streptosporangiaceae bacterium]